MSYFYNHLKNIHYWEKRVCGFLHFRYCAWSSFLFSFDLLYQVSSVQWQKCYLEGKCWNFVFDDDCFDEHDNEDEFYGYIDDNEIERITKHNEYDYDDDSLDNNNMAVADGLIGLVLARLFLLFIINYGCVCMCCLLEVCAYTFGHALIVFNGFTKPVWYSQ